MRPLQSLCGWAFSSLGLPCVAQRVWPRPTQASDPFSPAAANSASRLPTARTVSMPSGSMRAIPAESYPRYSRRLRPSRMMGLPGRRPT